MATRLSTAAAALAAAGALLGAWPAARAQASRVVRVRATAADSALSTTVSPVADCTISSGSPTSASQCGAGTSDLVGSDGNGVLYRTMISFASGLGGIPTGSKILSATLDLNVEGAFGSTTTWLFGMTRAFAPGAATWDTYDGSHAWSTPGGDFDDTLQASQTIGAAGTASFSLTALAQAWLDGTSPTRDLILVPYSPQGNAFSFSNVASGQGPTLVVAYQPPPTTPPTTTPVTTTPVTTPVTPPAARHALKVQVLLSWTWRGPIVRLRRVHIGRHPRTTSLTVTCAGRGCPRPLHRRATGARALRRLIARLPARYRAGDVLTIALTAPGYLPERARVRIRNGRKPLVRTLAS